LQQAVVTAGEAFSRLGVFPGFWLISLHNLLHATGGGGLGPKFSDFFS
jgi:hypothetical protein